MITTTNKLSRYLKDNLLSFVITLIAIGFVLFVLGFNLGRYIFHIYA